MHSSMLCHSDYLGNIASKNVIMLQPQSAVQVNVKGDVNYFLKYSKVNWKIVKDKKYIILSVWAA